MKQSLKFKRGREKYLYEVRQYLSDGTSTHVAWRADAQHAAALLQEIKNPNGEVLRYAHSTITPAYPWITSGVTHRKINGVVRKL
jgi:hypothetical protein